jgi:hypothetical protein
MSFHPRTWQAQPSTSKPIVGLIKSRMLQLMQLEAARKAQWWNEATFNEDLLKQNSLYTVV